MAKTYKLFCYLCDANDQYTANDIECLIDRWDFVEHQVHIEESQEYEWEDHVPENQNNCDLADLEARFEHDATGGTVVIGGVYRHFKGHEVKVLAVSRGTEFGETVVVYEHLADHAIWHRPISMFCSKVDRAKYPDVKQEYRFELVQR